MKQNIAYKYRIYPNEEQKKYFELNFNAAKFAYNKMLDIQEQRYALKTIDDDRAKLEELKTISNPNEKDKEEIKKYTAFVKTKKEYIENIKEYYPEPEEILPVKYSRKAGEIRTYKPLLSKFDMLAYFTAIKGKYEFLNGCDVQAINYSICHLAQAYKNFFNKNMPNAKKPVFKKVSNTYTTYNTVQEKKGFCSFKINGNYISIPKCQNIKIVMHRQIPVGYKIKLATISKESNTDYFISLTLEYEQEKIKNNSSKDILLTYIQEGLYIDDKNNYCMMPKYYQKSLKKLQLEQQKFSRMLEANIDHYDTVIGRDKKEHPKPVWKKPLDECKNLQKQKLKIQRLNLHIANQRKDFLHNRSKELSEKYGNIVIDDVQITEELKNKTKGERQDILNNGWNTFTSYLTYKAQNNGGIVNKKK